MEKYLRPVVLDLDPTSPTAAQEWNHWLSTFKNFLAVNKDGDKDISDKLQTQLLINHVSPKVFQYISESQSYETAIETLTNIFVKPKNEIYARHVLATRKQQSNECVNQYLQQLQLLSKDCQFKKVDAESNKNEYIRDAFISGITSDKIRQRLLECLKLDIDEAFNLAQTMETAEKNAQSYKSNCGDVARRRMIGCSNNTRVLVEGSFITES